MNEFINSVVFIFQRLSWLSVIDILLVAVIIFSILYLVRDTQAMLLLRGIILILVLVALLTSLVNLPAFSWLVRNVFPGLIFAIPVIFAPEIRRALERIGRAGTFVRSSGRQDGETVQRTIQSIATAAARLSARQHGALIVIERFDHLDDYHRLGVELRADVTSELLIQIFYPNTPLHDGAALVSGSTIVAAACVLPLSSSGILTHAPERKMGLRHRAALGITEVSDAIAVVVSEETGDISIAHAGRMIRHLDIERLATLLSALITPSKPLKISYFKKHFPYLFPPNDD